MRYPFGYMAYGPYLPECLNCLEEIPIKRLKHVPYAKYCVNCQAHRDEYRKPPAHVMAELSEADDVTRIREEGWLANG